MDKKCNGSSMIYGKETFEFVICLSCYLVLWPGSSSKLRCLKRSWSWPFLKNLCLLNVKKCTEGLVYNTILKCISNLLVILSSGFDYKFYFLYMKVFVAISLLSFRKTYKRNLHSFLNQKRLYHSLLMIF